MRIFQVITVSEFGGAQTVVGDLIEGFNAENEVFVIYGGEGQAWQSLKGNFTRIRFGKHRKQVSWRDAILLLKLIYYRIKYRPDVVHLHSSKMGALGRIAFNPKKIVYTMHGFDSVRKAHREYLNVELLLKKRAFKIVGVSQYDVDGMQEEGIVSNVACVYNGVDDRSLIPSVIKPQIESALQDIKAKYGKVVMCISRISKQKRIDLFFDIARLMPQYAFVWIGNKKEIEDHSDNVFCLGEVLDANYCLKYADLFILPSNYEGMPMSVLESLCFGVPVVASSVGGIPEVIDGTNGFHIANDSALFAEKISYILSDDDIYNTMSRNARSSYLSRYTVNRMVDGYGQIFNEIYTRKK